MKTKKHYPLWLLNLRYSKFLNLNPPKGCLTRIVTNWKDLKVNCDEDVIVCKRRSLLYRMDSIRIIYNDNYYYIISKIYKKKGSFIETTF